jgi:hypothetical protein
MAAECEIKAILEFTGLGKEIFMDERFTTTETPDTAIYQYRVQAAADTEEALDLGDVAFTTVDAIWIRCISNDLDIDTSYQAATFSAEITVNEGEVTIFKPNGTVGELYIKNNDAGEVSTFEYVIVGRT